MENKHWWEVTPWRMVQALFREIDMEDVDAERFAQDLADYDATVVNLNAAGILASYDTKLPYHTKSSYLTGSTLREMLDECHKRNIKVIARCDFSKIPFAVYEQHPDWAFRTADGGIVEQNGFVQTCQNGAYQQEKVPEILRELLTSYDFDGVYCNMSGFIATDYWGKIYGFCTCDKCKAGFKAAFNMDAPSKMDLRDPVSMRYMGYQSGCSKKLRSAMNQVIKAINPEIALDKVDFYRTESHTDIGEPIWIHSASSNSRLISGWDRSMVSDNANTDFMAFRYRESSVSPGVQELRQWQNLANSGCVSMFIMGRMDNHPDRTFYESSKKVFRFHKDHEDLLRGLVSAANVLLVCKDQLGREDPESYGWIRALTASHVPFDECKLGSLTPALLEREKVVILADVKMLKPDQVAMLDDFVRSGGTVVVSGESGLARLNPEFLGVQVGPVRKNCMSSVLKATESDGMERCIRTPLIPFGTQLQEVIPGENTRGYLTLVPEHPFGPPEVCYCRETEDIPGVTVHRHGEGQGILIPWNIGTFYHKEGYTNTLNVMQEVLFGFCRIPQIAPDLHETVELVLSRKEGKTVISLINASGYFGNSFFKPIPMRDITLNIPGTFTAATALNGGKATINENGIHLDVLNNFEMIVLEEQ